MSVTARLASFAAALLAVFGLAFALGRFVDVDVDTDDHGHEPATAHGAHGDSGYALALDRRAVRAGASEVSFRVTDEDGAAVTSYAERHERELHLIVVAADNMADYQHVHPTIDADGTWSAPLALAPGRYRLFADTQPTGADAMVLEADLRATGGKPVRQALPAPATLDRIGPYAVELVAEDSAVAFSVTRNGEPVTDLEPYLGAFGHLVALRVDDLAYLHAHPEDAPAGPEVTFGVEFGEPGRHALYFDFKHDGTVRTAQFTFEVGDVDADDQHGKGRGHGH